MVLKVFETFFSIFGIYSLIRVRIIIIELKNMSGCMLSDTHFYDGKLKERIIPYREQLNRIAEISIENKLSMLARLDLKLDDMMAKRMLDVIKIDGINQSNYDSSNDLWAIDILVLIIEYMELSTENYDDTLPILQEQLDDIANGSCPPGRTTRLFQIVLNCIESKNDSII